MARQARILFLLLILLSVALMTWQQRYSSTRWTRPLYVGIYPIAADDSPATRAYLANLKGEAFAPIDVFFAREGRRFIIAADPPVITRLRAQLTDLPPARAADAGIPATAFWSLRLRFWAWHHSHAGDHDTIRLFVLYHDPTRTPTVPHSLGLTKGLLGVVYAFATPTMNGSNDVVIAHELLHTVGASDKYAPGTNAPLYPQGYADAMQAPLYPQLRAEIMAGRRAIRTDEAEQIDNLDEAVVGNATATEIRWRKP